MIILLIVVILIIIIIVIIVIIASESAASCGRAYKEPGSRRRGSCLSRSLRNTSVLYCTILHYKILQYTMVWYYITLYYRFAKWVYLSGTLFKQITQITAVKKNPWNKFCQELSSYGSRPFAQPETLRLAPVALARDQNQLNQTNIIHMCVYLALYNIVIMIW